MIAVTCSDFGAQENEEELKNLLMKVKGMTEDETVGWHHRLNGYEFEQALGVGERQGSLVCCSPWGRQESGTTERLN